MVTQFENLIEIAIFQNYRHILIYFLTIEITRMRLLISLLIVIASNGITASNLHLSKPILYTEGDQAFAVLNVSWENAWHHERNNDAVWVFFKFLRGDREAVHVSLLERDHQVVSTHEEKDLQIDLKVPSDRSGIFLFPKANYRGHIHLTLKIFLDRESFKRSKYSKC